MKRFKDILCVMEPDAACQCALDRAVALAEGNQASVTIMTVIEEVKAGKIGMPGGEITPPELHARVKEAQAGWLESLIDPYRDRIDIDTLVLTGTPYMEIIREVLRSGRDLVIKCPGAPDWLERLFAGDDMHLLRNCPCPVWLVKPEKKNSYQRILAAVDVDDDYPPDEYAIRQALNVSVMELACSLSASEFAEMHVVHTWQAVGESSLRNSTFFGRPEEEVDAYVEQVRQRHAQHLDELMREMGEKLGSDAMDYLNPQLHLLKGSARKEIPSLAKRLDIDCIVMGTVARTGVRGFIMGNTAEMILEQINCSVLAVKPPGFATLVSLDD